MNYLRIIFITLCIGASMPAFGLQWLTQTLVGAPDPDQMEKMMDVFREQIDKIVMGDGKTPGIVDKLAEQLVKQTDPANKDASANKLTQNAATIVNNLFAPNGDGYKAIQGVLHNVVGNDANDSLVQKSVDTMIKYAKEKTTEIVDHIGNMGAKGGELQKAVQEYRQTFLGTKNNPGELMIAADDLKEYALQQRDEILEYLKNNEHYFINRLNGESYEAWVKRQALTAGLSGLAGVGILGTIAVGTATGIAGGVYGLKTLFNHLDRKLQIPELVLESSAKKTIFTRLLDFVMQRNSMLEKMVFEEQLQARLDGIVKSVSAIASAIKKGDSTLKFRNLLLWGAPGTGKTMFAKQLAHKTGLGYRYISGASFRKFSIEKAIEKMDELFAHLNSLSEPTLILIDEVESFLAEREGTSAQSDSYQLITNFLNHTGSGSNKLMFVFTTNRPEILDSAMCRRIDDEVEVKLPGINERARLLAHYINRVIGQSAKNGQITIDSSFNDRAASHTAHFARQMEGLSCGEIACVVNTAKSDTIATAGGIFTADVLANAVKYTVAKNKAFGSKFGKKLGESAPLGQPKEIVLRSTELPDVQEVVAAA